MNRWVRALFGPDARKYFLSASLCPLNQILNHDSPVPHCSQVQISNIPWNKNINK